MADELFIRHFFLKIRQCEPSEPAAARLTAVSLELPYFRSVQLQTIAEELTNQLALGIDDAALLNYQQRHEQVGEDYNDRKCVAVYPSRFWYRKRHFTAFP